MWSSRGPPPDSVGACLALAPTHAKLLFAPGLCVYVWLYGSLRRLGVGVVSVRIRPRDVLAVLDLVAALVRRDVVHSAHARARVEGRSAEREAVVVVIVRKADADAMAHGLGVLKGRRVVLEVAGQSKSCCLCMGMSLLWR